MKAMLEERVIVIDPDVMNGMPCFRGTRVPFKNLIDYLEGGHSLGEFLRQFPSVTREMACRMLERSESALQAAAAQIQSAVATIKPGEFRHLAIP